MCFGFCLAEVQLSSHARWSSAWRVPCAAAPCILGCRAAELPRRSSGAARLGRHAWRRTGCGSAAAGLQRRCGHFHMLIDATLVNMHACIRRTQRSRPCLQAGTGGPAAGPALTAHQQPVI